MVGREEILAMPPKQRIAVAYEGIRAAASILSVFPYEDAAISLKAQIDEVLATSPAMLNQADTADVLRKLRLLEAAAKFIKEWDAVKEEALSAERTKDSNHEHQ